MGVIEARRRILLSAPHPVTTTPASVATFNTDMVGKLKSAKFGFLPVQSGSGDPSPVNVRPISGWDGLTAYQSGSDTSNPTSYPVSWQSEAGTIYGGYVDVVRGEVVAEWASVDLGTLTWRYNTRNNADTGNVFYTAEKLSAKTSSDTIIICSALVVNPSYGSSWKATALNSIRYGSNTSRDLVMCSTYADGESLKTALSGVQLVYELATPIHYALTPQIIKSLKGANSLWSTGNGDTTITYWTH